MSEQTTGGDSGSGSDPVAAGAGVYVAPGGSRRRRDQDRGHGSGGLREDARGAAGARGAGVSRDQSQQARLAAGPQAGGRRGGVSRSGAHGARGGREFPAGCGGSAGRRLRRGAPGEPGDRVLRHLRLRTDGPVPRTRGARSQLQQLRGLHRPDRSGRRRSGDSRTSRSPTSSAARWCPRWAFSRRSSTRSARAKAATSMRR